MFRSVLALLVLASVEASRVQVHHSSDAESKAKWASCDHLQDVFRNRVATFQTFLDENPDLDAVGRAAQLRVIMRTYGIIRPLRRARECSWVVDEDGEEIEQARGIVQILLAGNPCAEAARSELESGTSAETPQDEIQSVQRAVNVLSSETCEVGEMPEETETVDEENVDAELRNAEDDLQDALDDVSPESAFIQTESSTGGVRGFMRGIAVAILMLVLLLSCVGVVAAIGALLAAIVTFLAVYVTLITTPASVQGGDAFLFILVPVFGMYGAAGAGVLGLAGCAYRLYNQMLPRLTQ